MVDTACNQVLRATVDNEELSGPYAPRFGFLPDTDVPHLTMRRWPVTQVLAVQASPMRSIPRAWTPLASGSWEIEYPLINGYTDAASATTPDGGYSILLAPGTILRGARRNSVRALVSYTNGWPHTSLTAPAAADATTLQVDDVTGWAGTSGFMYDGSVTEPVGVTAVSATAPLELPNGVGVAQAGPGTVTLSSPLAYAHAEGTLVSALPGNVLQANVLACMVQAQDAGIIAITAETLPGSVEKTGGVTASLQASYRQLLGPYCRTF